MLGAIAFTVGKYGIGSLKQLGMLVVLFYVAVIIFVVVVLGTIMRLSGFSIFKLLRYLREELAVVFATTSSDSVLPQIMRKLEALGHPRQHRRPGHPHRLLVQPRRLLDLHHAGGGVHRAGHQHADLDDRPADDPGDLAGHRKGAHGVPGSAIVVLAATLQAIPAIPAIGLVLVLSVDWFMGIARALGNLIGNCVATVAVAAWEGDIDRERRTRCSTAKRWSTSPRGRSGVAPASPRSSLHRGRVISTGCRRARG